MRTSSIKRDTRETNINLKIDIDGSGDYRNGTGNRMLTTCCRSYRSTV